MKPDGFRDLVRQAQAGDPPAMGRLLSLFRPYLESIARDYHASDHAAASASEICLDRFRLTWAAGGRRNGVLVGS